jgi:hypothetical protein
MPIDPGHDPLLPGPLRGRPLISSSFSGGASEQSSSPLLRCKQGRKSVAMLVQKCGYVYIYTDWPDWGTAVNAIQYAEAGY